eukprot:357020-Amphidinium_carterae.1
MSDRRMLRLRTGLHHAPAQSPTTHLKCPYNYMRHACDSMLRRLDWHAACAKVPCPFHNCRW